MQIRQGDVLLTKIRKAIAEDAKPVAPDRGRVVLAYGEVTGHAHVLDAALAELFEEEKDGTLYLRVTSGGAVLTHEEHGAISVPPGTYRLTHQREYSPEAVRRVTD